MEGERRGMRVRSYLAYGTSSPGLSWVKSLSRVRLFGTPWTEAYQAPPSMGFSRQEYWSGVFTALHGEENREEGVRGDPNEIRWNQ